MAKQDAFKLITYYLKAYERKFGGKPDRFNRYALSHGFECMHDDYGIDLGKEIIDYFIDTPEGKNPGTLVYTYGDIAQIIEDLREDVVKRETLREQTIRQVREAREHSSKSAGISSS